MLPKRKKAMEAMRLRLQAEYKRLLRDQDLNSDLQHRLFFLLKKRVNDIGIRSFFVHTLSCYVKEQAQKEQLKINELPDALFDTQLPFVAEGIITVQYLANQILDGKGGLLDETGNLDKAKTDRNLLASHYIKDFLYDYIDRDLFPEDAETGRMILRSVRQIFQMVDLGQDMQDHCGILEAYRNPSAKYIAISQKADDFVNKKVITEIWKIIQSQGIDDDKEWFVRNYLKRINLTSAALFVNMAKLVMDLLGYSGKEHDKILDVAAYIGIIGQIVNDNNDYVLPEAGLATMSKIPDDAFADLRNNNITLPLIFYLQQDKNKIDNLKILYCRFNQQKQHCHPFEPKNVMEVAMGWSKELVLKPLELVYRSLIPSLSPKTKRTLIKELFPHIELSIKTSDLMASYLESRQIIDMACEAGLLLLDMNSIANANHNRFYKSIYEHAWQANTDIITDVKLTSNIEVISPTNTIINQPNQETTVNQMGEQHSDEAEACEGVVRTELKIKSGITTTPSKANILSSPKTHKPSVPFKLKRQGKNLIKIQQITLSIDQ